MKLCTSAHSYKFHWHALLAICDIVQYHSHDMQRLIIVFISSEVSLTCTPNYMCVGPGGNSWTVQIHLPPCNVAAACYLVLTVLWVGVHETRVVTVILCVRYKQPWLIYRHASQQQVMLPHVLMAMRWWERPTLPDEWIGQSFNVRISWGLSHAFLPQQTLLTHLQISVAIVSLWWVIPPSYL